MDKLMNVLVRRLALVVAVVLAVGATATSQSIIPAIAPAGPGCGSVEPTVAVTHPVPGAFFTIHVANNLGAATVCDVVFSPPPGAPAYLGSGCWVYVDPQEFTAIGPFVTDTTGRLLATFSLPALPGLAGATANLQAVVASPLLSNGFALSNGLAVTVGNTAPFCTHGNSGWAAGEPGAEVLAAQFASLFAVPGYLEVGTYNPANGGAAPNGVRFTANAAGIAALQSFIGGGGSSGPFGADAINPTSASGAVGGGGFGKETIALALNVAFNDASLAGSPASGFSALLYRNPGDPLDGASVSDILELAHTAVSGGPLPTGYDIDLLKELLGEINDAFDACVGSEWGQTHLFQP